MVNQVSEEVYFQPWDGDRIMIAGSGDILPERARIEKTIEEALKLGPVTDQPIKPFSWDIDSGEGGLDIRYTMQQSLPLPSKPSCCGVICIVGERIGLPFERDFPLEQVIDNVAYWTDPTRDYRLHHPWPESAEQQEEVLKAGGFPLTGNTFEFLCMLQAGKPSWLGFLGVGDPTDETIALNRGRWRTAKSEEGLSAEAFTEWNEKVYLPQTWAVRNFARALHERGRQVQILSDPEELSRKVRAFVLAKVLPARKVGNPYRFLSRYEPNNGDHFFGREEETREVVELLLDRLASDEPAAVCITGKSGTGKSSLLRAGVVHDLRSRRHRGRIESVPLTPTEDLLVDPDRPAAVLERLLSRVQHVSGLPLSAGDLEGLDAPGVVPEQRAVDLLVRAITEGHPEPERYLVLAIDQLEEVVSQTADDMGMRAWLPLLRFLDLACQSGRIGVVYTLESSRIDGAEGLKLRALVRSEDRVKLDNDTDRFFRVVIREPFRRNGYPLGRRVIAKLMEQVQNLRDGHHGHAAHATLPILSMLLHDLYDHVAATREPLDASLSEGTERFDGSSVNEDLYVQLEDVEKRLDYQQVIQQIIQLACLRGGLEKEVEAKDLDHFLQLLVGVSGTDLEQIELRAIEPPPYQDDRRLADSFLRSRLILSVEGRLRLTHEAVLRAWPQARSWLQTTRPYLETRHRLRVRARQWHLDGRPPLSPDAELITRAAEVLAYSLVTWTYTTAKITQDDADLRDFCLEAFEHAEDGMTEIAPLWPSTSPPYRFIHLAAAYGIVSRLEAFAKRSPECLDLPGGKSHRTPLGHAAWNSLQSVDWLLKQKHFPIDPLGMDRRPDGDNWPALSFPIMENNRKIFLKLLRAAGDELPSCPGESSLLHFSARHNRVEMAQQLMDWADLEPNHQNKNGRTPLHFAAMSGAVDMVDLLLPACDPFARENLRDRNCVHLAASAGHVEVLRRLRVLPGYGEAVNDLRHAQGHSALGLAAGLGHADCVRELLPVSQTLTAWKSGDRTTDALWAAVPYESQGVIDEDKVLAVVDTILEDPRADPNQMPHKNDKSLLEKADHLPKLQRRLLDDPRLQAAPEDATSPLLVAAGIGYWSAFRRLMQNFGDTVEPTNQAERLRTILDSKGNTLLHHLVRRTAPSDLLQDHLELVEAEDLDVKNQAGYTPILSALRHSNFPAVRRLLKKNGKTLAQLDTSDAPLAEIALRAEKPEQALQLLIEQDPQALLRTNRFGWNLLHTVCASQEDDKREKFESLFGAESAPWDQTDPEGRRPIDLLRPEAREGRPDASGARAWPQSQHWDSGLTWETLPDEERGPFAERFDNSKSDWPITDSTHIEWTRLAFYRDPLRLVRIRDEGWGNPRLRVYFLQADDDLFRLNGTSPPIHEANARGRITDDPESDPWLSLTVDNIADYLRFFCFFVRGEEGPFLIHERFTPALVKDPNEIDPDTQQTLSRHARPTWAFPSLGNDPGWILSGMVWYSDALFTAWFSVQPTGMVDMLDDEPVASELGVLLDLPIS